LSISRIKIFVQRGNWAKGDVFLQKLTKKGERYNE
jgi:hypothetical protein